MRFAMRHWMLWTVLAGMPLECGSWTQYLWSGRWFLFLRGGLKGMFILLRNDIDTAQPVQESFCRVLERRHWLIAGPEIQEESYEFCPGLGAVYQVFILGGLLGYSFSFQWLLDSARLPFVSDPICNISGQDLKVQSGWKEGLIWELQNCISDFCGWSGSVGFIRPFILTFNIHWGSL